MGAELLIGALHLVETEKATYMKQDEGGVTFAPKMKKGDGLILWAQEVQKIHNLVRGMTPSPGAYTYFLKNNSPEKKRTLILKTQIHDTKKTKTALNPGIIVDIAPCGIHVATTDGFICVTQLQPEGKRVMDVQEYLRGHKITDGDMFVS
jgi:methionyl-tRNA formyltransferase